MKNLALRRPHPVRLWFAIALATPAGAIAAAPAALPRPGVADRYAQADRYLRPALDRLIVDADLRATFAADGKGVVYRLGAAGERRIMYFDLVILPHRVAQPFFWRKLRDYFTVNLLGETPPALSLPVLPQPAPAPVLRPAVPVAASQ